MSSEQSPVPDGAAPDPSDAPASRTAGPAASAENAPETAAPETTAAGTAATGPAADEVEVEDVVDPATVRRAPRYGRFFAVGIVLGTVLGFGIGGAWLQSPAAAPVFKPGVYFTVIVVTCAALGAGVAGLWAVLADRRSLRGRR
ncbi:hypothetical protein JN535_03770 [Cellulosimicrobium cellulans]|uniref:hypothetical protein n=1 Tax=Cellulosimicrobium cellulans TaxID=1710 RepID=UPI0019630992|nr:hypothetical protein [Cellulosimicrobium cellulans]MBN0039293.1 hypothetical protein [Cellulosimicrobium cellulans]